MAAKRLPVDYLLIVRHGDTEANEKGIDAGPLDYPLNKKGKKDALFIAKVISRVKVSAVYSSPVFRAVETAKILAKPHKLKVKILKELTEAKLKPRFVGKKGRHHILTSPQAFSETNEDLLKRTAKAVETVRREASGYVVMVSHGDVITAMLEGVVERKVRSERYYVIHPNSASLTIIKTKDRPVLALYNYHRKLFSDFGF